MVAKKHRPKLRSSEASSLPIKPKRGVSLRTLEAGPALPTVPEDTRRAEIGAAIIASLNSAANFGLDAPVGGALAYVDIAQALTEAMAGSPTTTYAETMRRAREEERRATQRPVESRTHSPDPQHVTLYRERLLSHFERQAGLSIREVRLHTGQPTRMAIRESFNLSRYTPDNASPSLAQSVRTETHYTLEAEATLHLPGSRRVSLPLGAQSLFATLMINAQGQALHQMAVHIAEYFVQQAEIREIQTLLLEEAYIGVKVLGHPSRQPYTHCFIFDAEGSLVTDHTSHSSNFSSELASSVARIFRGGR